MAAGLGCSLGSVSKVLNLAKLAGFAWEKVASIGIETGSNAIPSGATSVVRPRNLSADRRQTTA